MNQDDIFLLATQSMLKLVLLVSAPVVVSSALVGLIVALFQAATQLQEQVVSYAARFFCVVIVLFLTFPWMSKLFSNFVQEIFSLAIDVH